MKMFWKGILKMLVNLKKKYLLQSTHYQYQYNMKVIHSEAHILIDKRLHIMNFPKNW